MPKPPPQGERERPTVAVCGGEVGTAHGDNDTPPLGTEQSESLALTYNLLVTEAHDAERVRKVCKAHSGGGYFRETVLNTNPTIITVYRF
jgi:hypothetical protein